MIDNEGNRRKFFHVLNNEPIPKGATLLLSFGEIDCRAHLIKQAEVQNKDIDDIVKECVDRYYRFIKEVEGLGYDVWVWSPPAQTFEEKLSEDFSKEWWATYGSGKERNTVTKLFNFFLKLLHPKVIDIYDILIDKDNVTVAKYYQDRIHLGQEIMAHTITKMKERGLLC